MKVYANICDSLMIKCEEFLQGVEKQIDSHMYCICISIFNGMVLKIDPSLRIDIFFYGRADSNNATSYLFPEKQNKVSQNSQTTGDKTRPLALQIQSVETHWISHSPRKGRARYDQRRVQ